MPVRGHALPVSYQGGQNQGRREGAIRANCRHLVDSSALTENVGQVRSYFRRVLFKQPWENPVWAAHLNCSTGT